MQKTPFYFYCDEAGHLGHAGKASDNEAAISLVAGLIADEIQKEQIEYHCEKIYSKYLPSSNSKKFHITDLDQLQQQQLREDVFSFIKESNTKIVYSAIYFSALRDEFEKKSYDHEISTQTLKGTGVSLSRLPHAFNKRAHAETFYNYYVSAICFAIQSAKNAVSAVVMTDHIDEKILEELNTQINRTHTLTPQHTLAGSHYSYDEKTAHKFSVSINHMASTDPRIKTLMQSEGKIIRVGEEYSIVADIIANSIFYYLNKYVVKSGYGKLNCLDAIKEHPLADHIIGLSSTSLDNRYPHPQNQPLR